MILTILIIIILLRRWFRGYRLGLVGLIILTLSYFVALILARLGAHFVGSLLVKFGPSLPNTGWTSNVSPLMINSATEFFYNGIAFILIFILATYLSHRLLNHVGWLTSLPIIGTLNRWGGGLVNLVWGYLLIFVLLMVLQVLPIQLWQSQLATSDLAQWILSRTPGLTSLVISWLV